MKEAMFWSSEGGKSKKVKCSLCPWKCTINEGKTGYCGVRKNVEGKLYSIVYGHPVSLAVDPIEKKPLFHFAPGTRCLSIATVGCNLKCRFCQNFSISQEFGEIQGSETDPEEIVEEAKRQGVQGIAYTYTEPTIFYEYALDTMKLAKKEGLYNVWVSNGYTNPKPIKKASRYLDAVNVDIKGNDEFYRKLCGGKGVEPVHKSLKTYKKNNVFVEVTNLIIPGFNDSEDNIREMCEWIKKNLGAETPVHFSAFFPHYKVTDIRPTPSETIEKAIGIARSVGLKWMYAGNVYGNEHESTICWKCGETIMDRRGFSVSEIREKCPKCGTEVELRGLEWSR